MQSNEMRDSDCSEDEEINWEHEALAVAKDVGFALKSVAIASTLPCTSSEVYMNIETMECQKMCVQLSVKGFKVVSDNFDEVDEDYCDAVYYETPYALLNKYSPEFRRCFAEELQRKLSALSNS